MFKKLLDLNSPTRNSSITIVSGLPRSGTSMMMNILAQGGMDVVVDGARSADVDNPFGYYEFAPVKKLKDGENSWVAACRGKAVKVVSPLLQYLPQDYHYRVIFMRRDISEILASQKRMLLHRQTQDGAVGDDELSAIYQKHLIEVESWMDYQANMDVLFVNFNAIVLEPEPSVTEINRFLGEKLDPHRMVQVIDPSLYRHRA